MEEFTDADAIAMLRLIRKYVANYAPDIPQTLDALVEDLAMSMDVTTDEADAIRQEIGATLLF